MQLFEHKITGRACIGLDALKEDRRPEIPQVRGLLHHVVARQFIAALLENLHNCLRDPVAVSEVQITPIRARHVFIEEGKEVRQAGVEFGG